MKTSITFKGQKITRTKCKNNILKIYNQTSEDERYDWYQEANDYAETIARKMGAWNYSGKLLNIKRVCGVIAALSPVKSWSENKRVAKQLIETGECGHMKQFVGKAKRILECDGSDEAILAILNGRKISAFYLNIAYPNKANNVTIDRHALSVALGYWVTDEDYRGMTANQYNFFVQCYVLAAMKAEVSPLIMQSATWVKWRKIKKEFKK